MNNSNTSSQTTRNKMFHLLFMYNCLLEEQILQLMHYHHDRVLFVNTLLACYRGCDSSLIPPLTYPQKYYFHAFCTNMFMGRGKIKTKRTVNVHINLNNRFTEENDFKRILRIHHTKKLFNSPYSMSMKNKILLLMLFVIRYPSACSQLPHLGIVLYHNNQNNLNTQS